MKLPTNFLVRAYRGLGRRLQRSQTPVIVNVPQPAPQPTSGSGSFTRFYEGLTGQNADYRYGYSRERGRADYGGQRISNPLMVAFLFLLTYLFFSIWPFPFVPLLNGWLILYGFIAIWIWGRTQKKNKWVYLFLIIPVFVSLALLFLLLKGQQNKFYPAMPVLSLGCFIGYLAVLVI